MKNPRRLAGLCRGLEISAMGRVVQLRPCAPLDPHARCWCALCRPWRLHPAAQPRRIRELARSGLSTDAISLITGWGTLRIQSVLVDPAQ
jgi:hypothetical protein